MTTGLLHSMIPGLVPFPLFSTSSFQKPIAVSPRVVDGFVEKRMPGKNGEGTPRTNGPKSLSSCSAETATPFKKLKTAGNRIVRVFDLRLPCLATDVCGRHSQVGSLAGAAPLLNDNAGVLR